MLAIIVVVLGCCSFCGCCGFWCLQLFVVVVIVLVLVCAVIDHLGEIQNFTSCFCEAAAGSTRIYYILYDIYYNILMIYIMTHM